MSAGDMQVSATGVAGRLRRRHLIAALLAGTCLSSIAANADDATWQGGVSTEWLDPANWTPNTAVPDGVATFDGAATSTTVDINGLAAIGTIRYSAGALGYTINANDFVIVNGAGVLNNSSTNQLIVSTTGIVFQNASSASGGTGTGLVTYTSSGPMIFLGSSTSGKAVITNTSVMQFFETSNGGTATITNNSILDFFDNSSAASATITNGATSTVTFNNSATAANATITNAGTAIFGNSSSAGDATITSTGNLTFNDAAGIGAAVIGNSGFMTFNNATMAGHATIANSATLIFNDTTSAGMATITNDAPGTVAFNNSATAANSTIVNNATLAFNDATSGGAATITNNATGAVTFNNAATAGGASIANAGTLTFNDAASAGASSIANNGPATVTFNNSSTLGDASITNDGMVSLNDSASAGSALARIINNNSGAAITFNNSSTAGSATIDNSDGSLIFNNSSSAGSARITSFGVVDFFATSTAGNATIASDGFLTFHDTASAGGAQIGGSGVVDFLDSSTAGNAAITNGGALRFHNTSTAGAAIVANNGVLSFVDASSGGTARLINGAGGSIDISGLTAGGTTVGSIEGSGAVNLGTKNLDAGGNNLSTVFAGTIAGIGGSLTKSGTGVWTLSGVSTYTGATTVDAGTLFVTGSIASSSGVFVDPGATLAGTGAVGPVTVGNGGRLMPGIMTGPGTLTVNGNLTLQPGAGYVSLISSAGVGKTIVTGSAGIAGTLFVAAAPGSLSLGQNYTLITSAGLRTGTFDSFTSLGFLGFTPTVNYDDHNVFLTLQQIRLAGLLPSSGPANAVNVATALDGFVAGGGALPGSFQNLFALSPAALSGALNQAAGQAGLGADEGIYNAMKGFFGSIFDFASPGRGEGGGAIGFSAEPPVSEQATLAYAAVTPRDRRMVTKAELSERYDPHFGVWASAFGGTAELSGSAATGSQDLTSRVFGGAAGADYWVSHDTTLGLAMSGGETNYALANGFGTGRSDFVQGALYGRQRFGEGYVAAAVAGGSHRVKTERSVGFAGDRLVGDFTAATLAGRIEGGYRFGSWAFGLTPYGAVQVQSIWTPAYTETALGGGGASALSYNARDIVSPRTELGAWGDHRIRTSYGDVLLKARAAWVHNFNRDATVIAGFPALPGANFLVNGARLPGDAALVSAVAEVPLARNLTVSAKFDGEFAASSTIWSGTGKVRYVW